MSGRGFAVGPLVAAVLWGGMYVVSKWGFETIPPLTLSFLRLAVGAATLLVVVRVVSPSRSFSRREWGQFAGLGAMVALTIVSQFVGTDLTTASQGSLLTVLTPLFTLAFGVAAFGEAAGPRKIAGMGLAALGTLFVLAGQYDLTAIPAGNRTGVAFLLLASAGWAAYTVWGKPLVRRYSALETATYSTLFAVPMSAVLVPWELSTTGVDLAAVPVTPALVAAVLYLGVLSTAGAWYAWYKGLEFVDAGTVAVFFFAQPVVGAALGALLLDEPVGLGMVAGGAVMFAGIYLVSTGDATS
ncbi:DMT family transporter [Haloparvum alkalitolerans]|uniref:DMT family transporter n=1 Tax=Haloparvum alkalitolerans TaxID=1042953 RepID=UPI003CEE3CEB